MKSFFNGFTKKLTQLLDWVAAYRKWAKNELEIRTIIKENRLTNPDVQRLIVTEYNLIQEKKSQLSRTDRDKVEDQVSFMIRNKILKITIPKNQRK